MIGGFSDSITNRPGGKGDVINLDVDLVKSTLLYTDKILQDSKIDIIKIHGDFGLPNVFYKRYAPLFVIDFELSHSDWKLNVLAYFLNDYAFYNRQFIPESEEAFLEGYNRHCPISDEEVKYFPLLRLHSVLQRLTGYSQLYYLHGRRREYKISRGQLRIAQLLIDNIPELAAYRLTSEVIPHKKYSFQRVSS